MTYRERERKIEREREREREREQGNMSRAGRLIDGQQLKQADRQADCRSASTLRDQ